MSAVLICVAAWLPPVSLRRGTVGRIAVAATVVGLGGIALVVASVYERLPGGSILPCRRDSGATARRAPFCTACSSPSFFGFAAVGFGRRAVDRGSELSLWLANACVLAAFARLHYFMFPSLYSEWVYTGDFFRLGFYVLLVIGAAREIARLQRGAAEQPCSRSGGGWRVSSDGVAQEPGFIAIQAEQHIAAGRATTELEPVLSAARRGSTRHDGRSRR